VLVAVLRDVTHAVLGALADALVGDIPYRLSNWRTDLLLCRPVSTCRRQNPN
jgi:hypothetical protein